MARRTRNGTASHIALAILALPLAMPLAAQDESGGGELPQEWTRSDEWQAAADKASQTVEQMEGAERKTLTRGYRAIPFPGPIPDEAIPVRATYPGSPGSVSRHCTRRTGRWVSPISLV